MKICKHGTKIFNKTCSFEVSIVFLAPCFDHLIQRIPVIEVSLKSVIKELRIFKITCSFEISIVAVAPHFNHLLKRIPVIEVQ